MSAEINKWKDVPQERYEEWAKVFQSSKEIPHLSANCPLCGETQLYRYYQSCDPRNEMDERRSRGFIEHGGLWEWCRSCRSFAHYSALVPDWGVCDLNISLNLLTPYPTAIEEELMKREQE